MADTKIADPAPSTSAAWWAWAISYLPESWKKYVAVGVLALAAWFMLPLLRSSLPDMPTMPGWIAEERATKIDAVISEMQAAQIVNRDDLSGLKARVEALEKRLASTGSPKKK